jgi:regulator of cell morphogenesis and NO signaling
LAYPTGKETDYPLVFNGQKRYYRWISPSVEAGAHVPLGERNQLAAWQVAPLTDLIRHLVGIRHQECRDDMSRLETLLALLAMEPGHFHLLLVEIRDMLSAFCRELRAHLAREEQDLFPVLLAAEQGMPLGIGHEDLELLRSLLEEEHGHEVGLLDDINVFTAAVATELPADSPLVRLRTSLAGLSVRFQEHITLENEVLFPRMGPRNAVPE